MSARFITTLPLRDTLICQLLDYGLTVEELVALDRCDVLGRGEALSVGARRMQLQPEVTARLIAYCNGRKDGEAALFLSLKKRQRLTRSGVYQAIHAAAARGQTL